MTKSRTGAPTWAQEIRRACRLSHNSGWVAAVTALLGDDAAAILAAWNVFCPLFEAFIASDDWPLEVDETSPTGPGDITPA